MISYTVFLINKDISCRIHNNIGDIEENSVHSNFAIQSITIYIKTLPSAMQCFGPNKKLKLGREQVVTATHTPSTCNTHIHLQHRGSSVLVGGLRSGPPHSTDKCLAPARPQSAFTGQQIKTGGYTQICLLYSLCVCVCV